MTFKFYFLILTTEPKKNLDPNVIASQIEMNGLESIENKKIRIFKFDRCTKMRKFVHVFGKAILIMGDHFAFSITLDTKTRSKATIDFPRHEFLLYVHFALIKNELFIFGGYGPASSETKVRKL